MKDSELYNRLQSEVKEQEKQRNYDFTNEPENTIVCESCSEKTEKECNLCQDCNWCITSGRWKELDGKHIWVEDKNLKEGSCVFTQRYTQQQCMNYDENKIILPKFKPYETSTKLSIKFTLLISLISYIILSSEQIHCFRKDKLKYTLLFYLTIVLTIFQLYRLFMNSIYERKTKEKLNSNNINSLKGKYNLILVFSLTLTCMIAALISVHLNKCTVPFGVSLGIFSGFLFSFLIVFVKNIEPVNEKESSNITKYIIQYWYATYIVSILIFLTLYFGIKMVFKYVTQNNSPNLTYQSELVPTG